METTKKKRIVTKIGNVFCAEINNEHKRFFQYVANDLEELNSSVIRVFKPRYPMDYKPVIEDLVKDEVEFYAHTILKFGIVFNAWYKVGTSKNVGEGYKETWFGDISPDIYTNPNLNPTENWIIWKVNQPRIFIGHLNKELSNQINRGGVIPYVDIIHRLQFGYFGYKLSGWKVENGKNVPIIE